MMSLIVISILFFLGWYATRRTPNDHYESNLWLAEEAVKTGQRSAAIRGYRIARNHTDPKIREYAINRLIELGAPNGWEQEA